MKTFYIPCIAVLLYTSVISAQEPPSQVITPAGNSGTAGNVSLGWTLGEPVAGTAAGSTAVLTQGIQQPGYAVSLVLIEPDMEQVRFSVFPNPAPGYIVIRAGELQRAELYTPDGGSLAGFNLTGTETRLDLHGFTAPVMLLKLYHASGALHSVHRIQKIQ